MGVFYPMQTFSKSRKVNFKEIPIFIEGSANDTVQEIRDIASSISDYVISLSTMIGNIYILQLYGHVIL